MATDRTRMQYGTLLSALTIFTPSMRKLLALLPPALLFQTLVAQQEHRIEVEPAIPEVTVYLSGGEVRSAEEIALRAGRNTVVWCYVEKCG
jgi:hypothetical protein